MAELLRRLHAGDVLGASDWNAVVDRVNDLHAKEPEPEPAGAGVLALTAVAAAASPRVLSRRSLLGLGWRR